MHIEIHDRDALRAVHGDGVTRGHGGVVEKAEAHGRGAFGVVAGRTHGHEGVVHVAAHDFVHRLAGSADGVESGLQRPGTHGGVAVETGETVARGGLFQRLDVELGMNAQGHFAGASIGLPANQRHELFVFENAFDDAHAIRPFGMTGSIVVIEPGRMRNQ